MQANYKLQNSSDLSVTTHMLTHTVHTARPMQPKGHPASPYSHMPSLHNKTDPSAPASCRQHQLGLHCLPCLTIKATSRGSSDYMLRCCQLSCGQAQLAGASHRAPMHSSVHSSQRCRPHGLITTVPVPAPRPHHNSASAGPTASSQRTSYQSSTQSTSWSSPKLPAALCCWLQAAQTQSSQTLDALCTALAGGPGPCQLASQVMRTMCQRRGKHKPQGQLHSQHARHPVRHTLSSLTSHEVG
jgi:hypothetical protein